jgi:hypothetical protein
MDPLMLGGSIVIVVLGIHLFERLLSEKSTLSWGSFRIWRRSLILGVTFLLLGWILPREVIDRLHLRGSYFAAIPPIVGLALFAWILGRTIRRSPDRRAGTLAGVLATGCYLVLVFAWIVAVGMFFLGPGLH